MKLETQMWCVLTRNHPTTKSGHICQSTLSYLKKDAIKKFIDGSGKDWRYWKRKFNFTCERVSVKIETIKPEDHG